MITTIFTPKKKKRFRISCKSPMSPLNLSTLAFSTSFCPIENDPSGITVWIIFGIFKIKLWSTQNVNVPRFVCWMRLIFKHCDTDESISRLVKGNSCSFNFVVVVVIFFAEWQKCFEGHKNPEVVIYPLLLLLLLARKDSHKVTYLLQLTRSYFTPRLLLGNWWTLKPTVD